MSVIINEFEIVVEPPPEGNPAPTTPEPPVREVRPRDIEQIVTYFRKRRARVHAD